MANFALIGAAGFVAVRHMRAIAETHNRLVAALDPNDSVGVLDQYFPDAHFFVEFERFGRHLDELRRHGDPVSYLSVCSPNYLHEAHVRFGLRSAADVICEKPLVLEPAELDDLEQIEGESGKRVYTVLQLRLHPAIRNLRMQQAERRHDAPKQEVELAYITSRGRWYHSSWKGDLRKSGGIATNIGVHFFDMLQWVFGRPLESRVQLASEHTAAGELELERARVRWFLSIDERTLPPEVKARGQRTFRSITIGGQQLEFSEGFTDLHSASYRELLGGGGFGLADARPAIELVHQIRHAPVAPRGELHPLARSLKCGPTR